MDAKQPASWCGGVMITELLVGLIFYIVFTLAFWNLIEIIGRWKNNR
jgi:hypothetical protein